MKNNGKTSFIYKFLTFPEKLGMIFIYLIVIVLIIIDALLIVFAVPKVDYTYVPDYEETLTYEWMNPYVRSITGYYEDEDKNIYSSMTATFCYFGVDVSHKAKDTLGSFTIIDDKGDIYYVGDLTKNTSTTYSTTTTPLSRLSKALTGIKTIYGKVEFNRMLNGVSQGNEVLYFKEDIIELNKKDLENIGFSSEEDIKEVITSYNVFTKKDSDKYKIVNRFDIVSNVDYKFHLDYQLFGVDQNGEVLDLIGIYNLSNNYSKYSSLDTKVPERIQFQYYIGVFKIKINGEDKVLYVKKNVVAEEE